MLVTPSGITTEVILVLNINAWLPMVVTLYVFPPSLMIAGIVTEVSLPVYPVMVADVPDTVYVKPVVLDAARATPPIDTIPTNIIIVSKK